MAAIHHQVWRPAPTGPLTPPMTSSFEPRRPATSIHSPIALPPIAHFDRQLSAMHPLTPPDDVGATIASSTLPPIHYNEPAVSKDHYQPQEPAYEPSQPQEQPPFQSTSTSVWDSSPQTIDWLDFTRNRSAHFIAEKTCEMICYLWFASRPVVKRGETEVSGSLSQESSLVCGGSRRQSGSAVNAYPSPNHSPSSPSQHISPSSPKRSPPSYLQLVATPSFVTFMQKLLETTQVSQSVIVLSLHYIHRLKERNLFTPAQRGSEFRIAVAGLMMANKFLDDNTYTNKTWSEVSGIELEEINKMEREFLSGIDFNLFVDEKTYDSWLNLLKGLVIAKERDSLAKSRADSRRRDSRKGSTNARNKAAEYQRRASHHHAPAYPSQPPRHDSPMGQHYSQAEVYGTPARLPSLSRAVPLPHYSRARSTSPTPAGSYRSRPSLLDSHMEASSYSTDSQAYHQQPLPPSDLRVDTSQANHSLSNKRTAEAAFSPTSASFSDLPSKRPSSMILQIPDSSFGTGMASSSSSGGSHSYSPLESLSNFASMSLANGADTSPERNQSHRHSQHQPLPQPAQSYHAQPIVASTLVAPYSYSIEAQTRRRQPQELYFYTLVSSPLDEPRSRSRRDRREPSEDVEMPSEGVDQGMSEDEEEQEINGQRLRTRKGKLMRWYRGAETSSSSSYNHEYSRTAAAPSYSQPAYGYTSEPRSTSRLNVPQDHSPTYGSGSAPQSINTLPPLAHPVPRPHSGVIQSASTSPSGIYLRDLGYPGTAYPVRSTQDSRPYQPTTADPQPALNSFYSASYHPSPVRSKAEPFAPTTTYHGPHSHYNHPSNSTGADQRSTEMPGLPHLHDNIWSRPPAVMSLARHRDEVADEDRASDVGSDEYTDSDGSGRSTGGITTAPTSYYPSTTSSSGVPSITAKSQDSAVPTAPFANAGPAGVHVAFSDYSYGHSHPGYSYGYQPGYSTSYSQQSVSNTTKPSYHHHHHQPPAQHQVPQHSVHPHHSQPRYVDDWSSRGHREY